METQIKAIVFDAYGTLFNINSLDRVLDRYFGQKSDALSALWRKKQLEYTWLRTLMGRYKPFSEVTMDALAHSCNSLGLSLTTEIQDHLYQQYQKLEAYPEVPGLLRPLSEVASLGILSNANHRMLQGAIERNDLEGIFQYILSVEDISMFKPRPEVYQKACISFNLDPDQILFVSTNTWDVAGAKSYGLKVAWLNRFETAMEQLDYKADFVLEEMKELLKLGVFSA